MALTDLISLSLLCHTSTGQFTLSLSTLSQPLVEAQDKSPCFFSLQKPISDHQEAFSDCPPHLHGSSLPHSLCACCVF